MVKDRLEENKKTIAFVKKVQRWADKVGFSFIANICEDYLAQFTDEKYEVLEGKKDSGSPNQNSNTPGVKWIND